MTPKELEQRANKFCDDLKISREIELLPQTKYMGANNERVTIPYIFIAGAESQAAITEREVRQEIWKDVWFLMTAQAFEDCEFDVLEAMKKIILGTSEVGK